MSEKNQEVKDKKNKIATPRNIILAFGLLLMGAGFLFFGLRESINASTLTALRTFFLFVVGGLLFYRAMTGRRISSLFYISVALLCNGFVIITVDIGLLPYTLVQIWPLLVMVSGLVLIPTAMYKYGKLSSRFLVPAIMIFSMGVFFLLFSLDIITVSFVAFAAVWWPLFFILGGLSLVALFFYGKKKDSM
ncbi:MAG TPA: hypothetical protein PLG87_12960 [Treponemataceae bacterium]|nr:hypothetical protein [Treponemataceae bacterium]